MRGWFGALLAAIAAAVGAVGAATWARRQKSDDELSLEVPEPTAVVDEVQVTPAATGGAVETDDLMAIKGLGKVKAARLVAAGVTTYAQIAAWSEDDITEIALKVNTSPGQIKREEWIGQAAALAAKREG